MIIALLLLLATLCWIVAKPAQWLTQRAAEDWCFGPAIEKDAASSAVPPAPVLEIPDKVQAYCNGWWDQWAREESLERVKRLYMVHGDWDLAFQALLRQDKVSKVD